MALSKKVKLGELKHPIEIQEFKPTTDEMGFPIEEWTTIVKARAKTEFDDRLMREVFKDEGINSTSVKLFTFRYFKGLTEKHRILFNGVPYEVYAFNNVDDENRFYKVWARVVK